MRRVLLAVVAAALGSLLILSPAVAQDDQPGQITGGNWEGSQFDDADMRSGSAIRGVETVTVTGRFTYDPDNNFDDRRVFDASASASDPEMAGCEAPKVGAVTTEPKGGAQTKTFSFTVTSKCNVMTHLTVTGRTTEPGLLSRRYAELTTDLTFAVPSAHPVADVTASVEDTDSRKVDVSWAFPEKTEHDTTYVVQRLGPDPGDDDEWVDVSDPYTLDDDPNLVDDLTPSDDEEAEPVTGAYQYRVVAVRPHADATYDSDEIADVYVGVPPTTTTTTTPSSSTVTQPGSATTITVPRLGSSQTPDRNSTHTTVTIAPQSPVTTIDTGFEETLDYGDRDDSEPGELAAEGQSIISSDDESVVGTGAVAASLMVLVGWAGHVVYFRRLAAQF